MPRATPNDDPQPLPPVQPDLDDCCHSGCNPCVFDLYDDALERYQAALAQWRQRQEQQAAQAQQVRATAPATPRRQSKPRRRAEPG